MDSTTGFPTILPPAPPPPGGSFQVGRGAYSIDGYLCGNSTQTVIFYPKGVGPFNVVVYGHGAWGGVDGCDAWLETIAGMGLIVIAPFAGQSIPTCGKNFAKDMALALTASRDGGASLHPALSTADFSRTGFFGHSRGAKYALAVAAKHHKKLHIKAVLASHDVPNTFYENLTIPAMFSMGTRDKREQAVRSYFDRYMGSVKVFADVSGAGHMEPQKGMHLNVFDGKFLSCHVSQNHDDCSVIYGQSPNSLCRKNSYPVGGCIAKGPNETLKATTESMQSEFDELQQSFGPSFV